jgi:hypothetical protein
MTRPHDTDYATSPGRNNTYHAAILLVALRPHGARLLARQRVSAKHVGRPWVLHSAAQAVM